LSVYKSIVRLGGVAGLAVGFTLLGASHGALAAVPLRADPAVLAQPATATTGSTTGTTGVSGTTAPTTTVPTTASGGTASINLGGSLTKPSNSLEIILLLTLLSVAPAMLMMLTSFTRVVIVLSLTRNAMGLATVPPNQVLAGLALFVSLFIMTPTLKAMYNDGIHPYLQGQITQSQAYDRTVTPLRTWMLKQTDDSALEIFAPDNTVSDPSKLSMAAVVPAFILSEIKAAFTIGFVIFVPFLVIDLLVASTLMSMGMMMLPPSLISLPFKLLLFVLVNGWALVISTLIHSYR
jgi:flagellar biosynthetic protein FliP